MNKKKVLFLIVGVFAFCLAFLGGCSLLSKDSGKVRDLDFTVVSEENLSDELKNILDERKEAPFKVTFNDKNYLYICIGYGEQKTGGYSIAVDNLYLTADSIRVSTSLLGPGPDDAGSTAVSYPYIVLKTEYLDTPVIFE
ncbi:MAG: protease complex subunit PrcB family protein [Lachnospiraceae bacterium]|nr:protease complex subunit PrcB family protein [Lachnospiraceae bacterium]